MIIPVLDLRNGIAVRAVAGRRSEYRPIVSRLTDSCEPADVAEALLKATRSSLLYVADLDAIEDRAGKLDVAGLLKTVNSRWETGHPVKIWLDSGIRTLADHAPNIDPHVGLVIGTETIVDTSVAFDILRDLGPERAILSIDLIPGREQAYRQLLSQWEQARGRHVIWIDLAAVGTGRSVNRELIREAISQNPRLCHYPGGGVRVKADVHDWMRAGASGVLVSSALHDESIVQMLS